MKTLQDYLATNGSGSGPRGNRSVYVEASEIVKEHIKELEGKLGDIIGVRNLKLNVSVKLQKIVIESDNLLPYLKDSLWKVLFNDARFVTWGGNIDYKNGKVWFDLQFSYEYTRGDNGSNFWAYRRISFDLNTKEWTFEEMNE